MSILLVKFNIHKPVIIPGKTGRLYFHVINEPAGGCSSPGSLCIYFLTFLHAAFI